VAVAFSVLLSAATLALLRYALLTHGQPGDLAAYAAIYSVSSLSAVVVDFVYIRLGQNIVVGAREHNQSALTAAARKIARPVIAISIASLLISTAYATIQLPRPDGSSVLAAVIIVTSFALRSIYIFFQNILVGLKNARFDFLASGLALAVAALISPYLIAWWPLVGVAVSLMLISFTYVITLASIVSQLRKKF
jgi:O-antigen/teichoic acid export membrane protein